MHASSLHHEIEKFWNTATTREWKHIMTTHSHKRSCPIQHPAAFSSLHPSCPSITDKIKGMQITNPGQDISPQRIIVLKVDDGFAPWIHSCLTESKQARLAMVGAGLMGGSLPFHIAWVTVSFHWSTTCVFIELRFILWLFSIRVARSFH